MMAGLVWQSSHGSSSGSSRRKGWRWLAGVGQRVLRGSKLAGGVGSTAVGVWTGRGNGGSSRGSGGGSSSSTVGRVGNGAVVAHAVEGVVRRRGRRGGE